MCACARACVRARERGERGGERESLSLSNSGVAKGSRYVGYVIISRAFPDTLKDQGFLSSESGRLLGLLDPEHEDTMIVQNNRNYLPDDTASQPRTLESSVCMCCTSYISRNSYMC